ncbi:MAG: PocR ligand-binding domain-containing protein [Anaerolineae bacterium]|nr:PocR ligand-binding domain-containing protein [Anaerolineae bacterium]
MKFIELVDISELRELCNSFTALTDAATAILDLEGNILIATGWKDICTRFHRVNPKTACRCLESDTVLAGQLKRGEPYNVYQCKNGLIDVAVPITVGDEHVANFFTGQFFFEPPDRDYFIHQAEEFGFDKTAYLDALNRVPVFTEDQVKAMMNFFSRLARLIGEMGLARKRLEEVNMELRKHQGHLEELVRERTAGLVKAQKKAETANRAKSVFLANMSHELRTPLNAVLGFSRLMQNDRQATAEQKEYLTIINRSGEHLLNLINNVLDISKIEAGHVTLEESPLDLYQLAQELKSLMYARAFEKELGFTLEQSPDLPRQVVVDGGKLRQILINLIGNAIKYTAQGRVTVKIDAEQLQIDEWKKDAVPDQATLCKLRFSIGDTGPGIRVEDRERIFLPFVQLEDRPSTEVGTGLGLAICKQYVELMGGTIRAAGEPGRGAVFHVALPVVVLSSEAIPAEARHSRVLGLAEGQPHYRLLIAEDQPENRLLLRRLLEPFGFELREAVNGQEAVDIAAQWRPHLIWMDIRMPFMDGLEATRQIKGGEAGAQIKVIAITAHALEEERRAILAAGCDDCIRKPYKDVEILDTLANHLGVRFTYAEETSSVAVASSLNMAALTGMPGELRHDLEHALVRLDSSAVHRAIEAIRVRQPALADALAAVARDLQFGQMLRMLRAAQNDAGKEDEICLKP